MKKLLPILVLGALCYINANAQLSPIKKVDKIETVDAVRAKNVILNKRGNTYFIAMTSTNQFDDYGIFLLGDTKDGTLATLSDLIELCNTLSPGESIVVNNGGEETRIRIETIIGKPYLQFSMDGIAGVLSGITPKELKRFYKKIAGVEYSAKQNPAK